jgi:hypothetical protein
MTLTKEGLTYEFSVDPATSTLRRLNLSGTQNGVTVAMRETLTQITSPRFAPADTFKFTPDSGAAKVAAVSVDPF